MKAHLRLVDNDHDGSALRKLFLKIDELQSELMIATTDFEQADIEVRDLMEMLSHLEEVMEGTKASILHAAFHHDEVTWRKDG